MTMIRDVVEREATSGKVSLPLNNNIFYSVRVDSVNT